MADTGTAAADTATELGLLRGATAEATAVVESAAVESVVAAVESVVVVAADDAVSQRVRLT